jgi:hypothetical protein
MIISPIGFGMHLILHACCNIWFIQSFNLVISVYLNNLISIMLHLIVHLLIRLNELNQLFHKDMVDIFTIGSSLEAIIFVLIEE